MLSLMIVSSSVKSCNFGIMSSSFDFSIIVEGTESGECEMDISTVMQSSIDDDAVDVLRSESDLMLDLRDR